MNSGNDLNDIKVRIIRSLFSYRTENGELIENYITHVKVLEESYYYPPSRSGSQHTTRKLRYILISVKNNGNVQIHKSRENSNGTFSIGKTWDMNELQRIDNIDTFKVIITLQKPYHWICESEKDKMFFVEVLVKIYKKFTGGKIPIMNGFDQIKNSDIIDYIPQETSISQRHSFCSQNVQKNSSEPSSRCPSISNSLVQNSQYSRFSSGKHSLNSLSLNHNFSHSQKINKHYTDDGYDFSNNQYYSSDFDLFQQSLQKHDSVSFSIKSNPSETFRSNSFLKYEHELSLNKVSDNFMQDSLGKDRFSDDLSSFLKKQNDHETMKLFTNEKDMDDFVNYIDGVLNDFQWTTFGNTEKLEEKLKDELSLLETENICAIIESDNRTMGLDEKLLLSAKDCKKLSSILSLYSVELNSLKDDILCIENQSKGLQVQTVNQKKLALELQNLLDTLSVDVHDLEPLRKASFESTAGIMDIEKSLTFLYRILKISITSEMDNEAATGDVVIMRNKKNECEKESNEFLSRLAQYLNIKFQMELKNLVHRDYSPSSKVLKPQLISHVSTYMSFYRYQSFMLYAKQLNPAVFATFQEYYIKYSNGFYSNDFEKFFNIWKVITKKETSESVFTSIKEVTQNMVNIKSGGIKRSATTIKISRGPITDNCKDEKTQEIGISINEAFSHVVKEFVNTISQEQNFITAFFHLISSKRENYDELVSWNNNQIDIVEELKKKRPVELNRSLAKLVLNMMFKIMGSLDDDLLKFSEFCYKIDPISIIENIESLKKHLLEWKETDQEYLIRILNKLHYKHIEFFHMFIDTQIQAIENLRLLNKRKQGVFSFFKIFPNFVEKCNKQISNFSNDTDTKELLYEAFRRIESTMFKTFKILAQDLYNLNNISKSDSEDKELLNYYIMIIENMFHYIQELKKKNIPILNLFEEKADTEYKEYLKLYVDNVLKRPLGRIMEFSENINILLKTKSIEEIKNQIAFSPVSLKRIITSYDIKEVLKGIEILYKRVEKHFKIDENYLHGQLATIVWNKISDEYRFIIENFHQLIANYYKTDGIYIDWSYDDIRSSFFRKGM
ncbi:hypothetical protein PCANB_001889 [Pneumocystis canis]|nr:hypothetical protein PCANB_001889 [Pneumocystis canis]